MPPYDRDTEHVWLIVPVFNILEQVIEVFHTRDQNHVTVGAAPFWESSLAPAAVAAVYML